MPLGRTTRNISLSDSDQRRAHLKRAAQMNTHSLEEDLRDFRDKCKQEAQATGNCWRKGKRVKAVASGCGKILGLCIVGPLFGAMIVAMAPFALCS